MANSAEEAKPELGFDAYFSRPDVIRSMAAWEARIGEARLARAAEDAERNERYKDKRFVPQDGPDYEGCAWDIHDRKTGMVVAGANDIENAELICRLLEAHYVEQARS